MTKYTNCIYIIPNTFADYFNVIIDQHKLYISKWFAFKRLAFLMDKEDPRHSVNSIEVGKLKIGAQMRPA